MVLRCRLRLLSLPVYKAIGIDLIRLSSSPGRSRGKFAADQSHPGNLTTCKLWHWGAKGRTSLHGAMALEPCMHWPPVFAMFFIAEERRNALTAYFAPTSKAKDATPAVLQAEPGSHQAS